VLDSLTPAQTITVTVSAPPRREDQRQTIERLMRQDPEIKAALRRTQRHRAKTNVTRSRGKRPWTNRRTRTQVARAEPGAAWTMAYLPSLRRDLESVSDFIQITPK